MEVPEGGTNSSVRDGEAAQRNDRRSSNDQKAWPNVLRRLRFGELRRDGDVWGMRGRLGGNAQDVWLVAHDVKRTAVHMALLRKGRGLIARKGDDAAVERRTDERHLCITGRGTGFEHVKRGRGATVRVAQIRGHRAKTDAELTRRRHEVESRRLTIRRVQVRLLEL